MTESNHQPSKSPTRSRSAVIIGAWVCFIIGMALMFMSLYTFFLYGPLFLACFILSIIGMAQGRVVAGVSLLLASIIVPPIGFFGALGYRVTQEEKHNATILAKIKFEDVSGYIDGNYMYLKGKVRNDGTTTAQYVKVGVDWLDQNGKVLDTGWTYAVGSDELRPGSAKSFEIMTTTDGRMERFRYYVIKDGSNSPAQIADSPSPSPSPQAQPSDPNGFQDERQTLYARMRTSTSIPTRIGPINLKAGDIVLIKARNSKFARIEVEGQEATIPISATDLAEQQ
jgi:hypothetical protein